MYRESGINPLKSPKDKQMSHNKSEQGKKRVDKDNEG